MRCPSAKALEQAFRISREKANLVRKIAKAVDSNLEAVIDKCCPKTAAYAQSCHNNPYNMKIWRVTMALHAINDVIGGHGVEVLGPPRSGDYAPPYEYVNMGDTYATTLIYKRSTDNLFIGNWGDIAEKHPSWE